jgi:hypothetical protein
LERKRELKEQYKQMKPDMGLFIIKAKDSGRYHLEGTQNLKGKMNSLLFQLKMGSSYYKELQKDWKEKGEDNFIVEIVEKLEYDKDDEAKTDYTDELELLKMIWQDKLPGKPY